MAKARDAFGAVLRSLRQALREGRYARGVILNVGDLASEYGTSTTPVREALAHLAGEGLIDDSRGVGHMVAGFEPGEAAGCYALRGLYLREALRREGADTPTALRRAAFAEPVARDGSAPNENFGAVSRVFARVVLDARDRALATAFRLVDARLASLKLGELRVLPDLEAEARELLSIYADQPSQVAACFADYHARRVEAAEYIQDQASYGVAPRP